MSQTKEEFRCDQCNLTFFSREELEEHMRQHERAAKLFRCEKCKTTFNSQEELEKHIRKMHSKESV